jgi:hypothetical protein
MAPRKSAPRTPKQKGTKEDKSTKGDKATKQKKPTRQHKSIKQSKQEVEVEQITKFEPKASPAPDECKEALKTLMDQSALFSLTIDRRNKNLSTLNRATAALKSHIDNLNNVAASNRDLIAEVEKDMQAEDAPVKSQAKKEKRAARFRVSKASASRN